MKPQIDARELRYAEQASKSGENRRTGGALHDECSQRINSAISLLNEAIAEAINAGFDVSLVTEIHGETRYLTAMGVGLKPPAPFQYLKTVRLPQTDLEHFQP